MSWYSVITHNFGDYTKMLYVAEISKFPNYIVLKSSTMQKGQGTISREAAFRKSDSHLGNPLWTTQWPKNPF